MYLVQLQVADPEGIMAHLWGGQQLGHGDGQNLKSCPLRRPGGRNLSGRLQSPQRSAGGGRTFVGTWAVAMSSSCLLNTTSRKVQAKLPEAVSCSGGPNQTNHLLELGALRGPHRTRLTPLFFINFI